MLSLEPNVVSRHTFVVYSYTVKWIQSIHVQALRRSMSIRGSPERLKTGNKQTEFSLDQSMLFKDTMANCEDSRPYTKMKV